MCAASATTTVQSLCRREEEEEEGKWGLLGDAKEEGWMCEGERESERESESEQQCGRSAVAVGAVCWVLAGWRLGCLRVGGDG